MDNDLPVQSQRLIVADRESKLERLAQCKVRKCNKIDPFVSRLFV